MRPLALSFVLMLRPRHVLRLAYAFMLYANNIHTYSDDIVVYYVMIFTPIPSYTITASAYLLPMKHTAIYSDRRGKTSAATSLRMPQQCTSMGMLSIPYTGMEASLALRGGQSCEEPPNPRAPPNWVTKWNGAWVPRLQHGETVKRRKRTSG